MRKETMKKIIFRLFLVCSLIFLTGVSCTSDQQNLPTEPSQYLSLVDLLAMQDDFSGNWEWNLVFSDKDIQPTPDSNLSANSAFSYLAGHLIHDSVLYTFTFTHNVRIYRPATQNEYSPFTDNELPEPFPILLVKVGDSMETRCSRTASTKPNPIFLCETLVKYTTVTSFLRITGEVSAGEQLIESIINQLLTSIDTRIEANQ